MDEIPLWVAQLLLGVIVLTLIGVPIGLITGRVSGVEAGLIFALLLTTIVWFAAMTVPDDPDE